MSKQAMRGFAFVAVWPLLFTASAAQAASSECEKAWAAYNEFKSRTVMEESQYTLTVQGAAVRAACGKEALAAPPNADIVPVRPRVRKPRVPPPPPPPPEPAPEPTPPGLPRTP